MGSILYFTKISGFCGTHAKDAPTRILFIFLNPIIFMTYLYKDDLTENENYKWVGNDKAKGS